MRLLLITMNEILFNSLPHIRTKGNVDVDNNMVGNMGNTAVDVDSNMAGNSMDNMVLDMGSGYMVVFHLQEKVVLQN
jgi:hypothetical protein